LCAASPLCPPPIGPDHAPCVFFSDELELDAVNVRLESEHRPPRRVPDDGRLQGHRGRIVAGEHDLVDAIHDLYGAVDEKRPSDEIDDVVTAPAARVDVARG